MPTFITSVAAVAAEAGGVHLPMPVWGFFVLTLAIFLALLGLVWSFRHTAQSLVTADHGSRGHGAATANANPDDGRRH